jgi:hypothetical protein
MTQPTTPTQRVGLPGLPGGIAGASPRTPNVAPPKPEMTDKELRLECVKLAVQANALRSDVVALASEIEGFVKGGGA